MTRKSSNHEDHRPYSPQNIKSKNHTIYRRSYSLQTKNSADCTLHVPSDEYLVCRCCNFRQGAIRQRPFCQRLIRHRLFRHQTLSPPIPFCHRTLSPPLHFHQRIFHHQSPFARGLFATDPNSPPIKIIRSTWSPIYILTVSLMHFKLLYYFITYRDTYST